MKAGVVRKLQVQLRQWTTWVPLISFIILVATWGRTVPAWILAIDAALLMITVMAAVHHAEVIAARVGEPFGSLILAVAVTVIEVGLIVMLMTSGKGDTSTLARDTVFSAVMLTMNGIVGLSLLVGAHKYKLAVFNSEGAGSALGTVILLAVLTMVLPAVTTSTPFPTFVSSQLVFVALASLVLYGSFVFTQTIRHRSFFLPPGTGGAGEEEDAHGPRPGVRRTAFSVALLLVALVTVVGLAKAESPALESIVSALGFPNSFVGVILAVVVLLPESIAAVRAAASNRAQIALNLGYGSAMASIGLTIPTMAVASIWLPQPLTLGLSSLQILLLATSAAVSILTVVPGRAKSLHGILLLVLLAGFLLTSVKP